MRTKIDLRRAIKERFGTISAFAEKTGMRTQNIIQNMINGNPTIKKLEELCEKMNCDVTDLFYPIDDCGAEEINKGADNTPQITEKQNADKNDCAQDTLQTTTFCPHCGTKVKIGVVMIEA